MESCHVFSSAYWDHELPLALSLVAAVTLLGRPGDSSAFSWFRIWDLFRISSFGFRISLPDLWRFRRL